jgi:DNA-binding CsgD family transcriptional regulator
VRVETVVTIAREGVRGASFAERLEVVSACLEQLVPGGTFCSATWPDRQPMGRRPRDCWLAGPSLTDWQKHADEYSRHDFMTPVLLANLGTVVRWSDLVPAHRWGCDIYTAEVMGDVQRFGASVYVTCGEGLSCLSVGRPSTARDFTTREMEIVSRVARALSEGVALDLARERLTPRERQVGELAAQGLGTRQIGKLLGVSESTINVHIRAVYRKLGIDSRAQLGRLL